MCVCLSVAPKNTVSCHLPRIYKRVQISAVKHPHRFVLHHLLCCFVFLRSVGKTLEIRTDKMWLYLSHENLFSFRLNYVNSVAIFINHSLRHIIEMCIVYYDDTPVLISHPSIVLIKIKRWEPRYINISNGVNGS